jgi:hypothetical protein
MHYDEFAYQEESRITTYIPLVEGSKEVRGSKSCFTFKLAVKHEKEKVLYHQNEPTSLILQNDKHFVINTTAHYTVHLFCNSKHFITKKQQIAR